MGVCRSVSDPCVERSLRNASTRYGRSLTAFRCIVRTDNQWRFMPGNLPPWAVVDQTQRPVSFSDGGGFALSSTPICLAQAPSHGYDCGWPHRAVHVGVGRTGLIRRRQATQGLRRCIRRHKIRCREGAKLVLRGWKLWHLRGRTGIFEPGSG